MSIQDLQGWLNAGLGVGMLMALILGYRRLWVFGWYAADLEKQRDEWKQMAIGGLEAAAEVARAARRHTTFSDEQAELAVRVLSEAGRKDAAK